MQAIDLTKVPTSYVYQLDNMKPSPEDMFYDDMYSFERMRDAVDNAVRKAKSTRARERFLNYLNEECFLKRDIENLCANAIRNGRNYMAPSN